MQENTLSRQSARKPREPAIGAARQRPIDQLMTALSVADLVLPIPRHRRTTSIAALRSYRMQIAVKETS